MQGQSASFVVECENCGEEYEIDFRCYAPDRSVGDHGGAELDGPTECPECGKRPTEEEIEQMQVTVYESAAEDEALAHGDALYERSRDRW
jgi:hypothetical protein